MSCITRCFNNNLMCEFVKQCQYSGRKYDISLIESLQVFYDCTTRTSCLLRFIPRICATLSTECEFPKAVRLSYCLCGFVVHWVFLWNFFWHGAETPKPCRARIHPDSADLVWNCQLRDTSTVAVFTSSSKVFEQETAEYERHSISVYFGHSGSLFRICKTLEPRGTMRTLANWNDKCLRARPSQLVVSSRRPSALCACEETNLVFHLMTDPWLQDPAKKV